MSQTLAAQLSGKRIALSLSSGFFGFYHHVGVLRAIAESGITPCAVSGTSAGAIVAAMYSSGLTPDQIQTELLQIRRSDFWDIQFPFSRSGFGFIAGHRFGALLSRILPVHRFEDCKVPLHLGVYRVRDGRSLTLSSGSLIEAVRASCAVPYMFAPVSINGEVFWDGGFAEKTPLGQYVADNRCDAVLISHLPPREDAGDRTRKTGLFANLSFGVNTPLEERIERDRRAVELLRDSGKDVFVLAPPRVWLGPFSLDKAVAAARQAYDETLRILNTPSCETGCDDLQ